eukprot:Hpha_TRINITY_DN14610_c2_g5::TRINITY_DN14610_c2_g5_i1::g.48309::m.48309
MTMEVDGQEPQEVEEPEVAPAPVLSSSKGSLPPPPGRRAAAPERGGENPTEAEAAVMGGDDSEKSSSEESSSDDDEEMEEGHGQLVVHTGEETTLNKSLLGPGGVEAVVLREGEQMMGFEFDENLVLMGVIPDTPAAAAGLGRLVGMQLRHVNGEKVEDPEDLPDDFLTSTAVILGLAPAKYKKEGKNRAATEGALVPVVGAGPLGGQLVATTCDEGWRPSGVPSHLPAFPNDGLRAPLPKVHEVKCPPLARVPRALSGRYVSLPKQENGQLVPVCVAGGVPEQTPAEQTKRRPFYAFEGPQMTGKLDYSQSVGEVPRGAFAAHEQPTAAERARMGGIGSKAFRANYTPAPSRSGKDEVTFGVSMFGSAGLPEAARRPGGALRFDAAQEIPMENYHEVLPFKPSIAGEAPQPSAPHGKGPGWTPKPPPSMHPDRGLMFDPDRERGTAPGGSTCLSVGRKFTHDGRGNKGEVDKSGRGGDAGTKFQGQWTNEWGETHDGTLIPGKSGESYVPGRGRQDGSGMGNATSARIKSARPAPTSTPGEELRFEMGCEMLSFGESLLDVHLTVPGTAAHARKNKIIAMKRALEADSDDELDEKLKAAGCDLRHPGTGARIDERDFHSVPNEVLQNKGKDPAKGLVINRECGEIGGIAPPPSSLLPFAPKPPLTEADRNRLIANFRARHNIPDEFEYALRGLDSEGLRSVLRPLLDAGRDPTTVLTARINLEKRRIRSDQLKLMGGNVVRENQDPKNDPMLEEAEAGNTLAWPCPGCNGALNSFTTDDAWMCSGCSAKFPKGTAGFHGCKPCDFDLCPTCSRSSQAKVAAVSAAVILAGRALEALADAWEHAKRRQAAKRRVDKRKQEVRAAQSNPLCAGLPFQPGQAVEVVRSNGVWSAGRVKAVKENAGTVIYVVALAGEGNFLKQIPVKRAEGKIRPRHDDEDGDVHAKRQRMDLSSGDDGLSSTRAGSASSGGRASSRGY